MACSAIHITPGLQSRRALDPSHLVIARPLDPFTRLQQAHHEADSHRGNGIVNSWRPRRTLQKQRYYGPEIYFPT